MTSDNLLPGLLLIVLLFMTELDSTKPEMQYDSSMVDSGGQFDQSVGEGGEQTNYCRHDLTSNTCKDQRGGQERNMGGPGYSGENKQATDKFSATGRQLVPSPYTIVTALFDLGREKWRYFQRSFDTYLTYSVQLLQLDVPIIAYVDVRTEKFVRLCRRGKEHLTVIHVVRLEDLQLYERYDAIVDVMQSEEFKRNNLLLDHPEGFSAEYNILMNSKAAMLLASSNLNVYNSTHFFWMDMGYGHGHDIYPQDNKWIPQNLIDDPLDRITYIAVNNLTLVKSVYDIYKRRVGPGVNGGFFGGSARAIAMFYEIHGHVFDDFLRSSMIDDDQTIAIECYLRYPQLFNMVRGGWYDVFKMFS